MTPNSDSMSFLFNMDAEPLVSQPKGSSLSPRDIASDIVIPVETNSTSKDMYSQK